MQFIHIRLVENDAAAYVRYAAFRSPADPYQWRGLSLSLCFYCSAR